MKLRVPVLMAMGFCCTALVSVTDVASSLGDLAAAGGTAVGVDVAVGGNLVVGEIRTGVPLVKTGAGMLSVSGGVVAAALDVRSGSVRFVDCEHDAVPLTVDGSSRSVTVEDGTISVAAVAIPDAGISWGQSSFLGEVS